MELPYLTGMAYVTIITMLAIVQYSYFSFKVGQARGKFDVEADTEVTKSRDIDASALS